MAQLKQEQLERKQELVERLNFSREALGSGATQLKKRINIPQRLKSSIQANTQKWLLGSTVTAIAAGVFMKGAISPRKKGKFMSRMIRNSLIALAKPYAKSWLINKGAEALKKNASSVTSRSTVNR